MAHFMVTLMWHRVYGFLKKIFFSLIDIFLWHQVSVNSDLCFVPCGEQSVISPALGGHPPRHRPGFTPQGKSLQTMKIFLVFQKEFIGIVFVLMTYCCLAILGFLQLRLHLIYMRAIPSWNASLNLSTASQNSQDIISYQCYFA